MRRPAAGADRHAAYIIAAQSRPDTPTAAAPAPTPAESPIAAGKDGLKDAWLAEIRKSKPVMYNSLVVQAQRLDVAADRITLTFAASQKIAPTFDKYRPELEAIATRLAGRKITVVSDMTGKEPDAANGTGGAKPVDADRKTALKEQALADAGVQAMLEVFPAEIRDVEEM